MCLGLAMGFIKEKGNKIRDGDRFYLNYQNGVYSYEAKTTPNGIVLVPLESDAPIGRKLDFIVQEMNREANTIGSKVSDAELAHVVVDIKGEIEKIREQIQNIE